MTDFMDIINRCTSGLLRTATDCSPETPVTTCGAWTMSDLVGHLTTVQFRAIGRIGQSSEIATPLALPTNYSELIDLGYKTLQNFDESFGSLAGDAPCWNWTGSNQNVGWMRRRQAHESTIHFYDALHAVGNAALPNWASSGGIDQPLAADGIREFMEVFLPRVNQKKELPNLGSLHIHATDGPATSEWYISMDPDGKLAAVEGHQKADTVIRGSASDILLWIWGRREPIAQNDLEKFGDLEAISAWRTAFSI
ncbi:MAG: hypothetical protein HKL82_11405 [Acidimicrobiaceae bacterium]|nr:hypothetical protein [Acidimicrobiaceae bacterium]